MRVPFSFALPPFFSVQSTQNIFFRRAFFCQKCKFLFPCLTKRGRAIIVASLNLIVHKYHDGEKFVLQTLQRVAGRCEAMQRRNDVTGPRVFPLRRRCRLGGNGFPHRYQRGGIRTQACLRRADAGSGHFLPIRVVPRKFRLSSLLKKETKAFFVICFNWVF